MWEIISGILGILGFILSLINITIFLYSRNLRFNVSFGNYDFKKASLQKDIIIIEFRFDNNSELPLSITRIQIKAGKNFEDIYPIPIIAVESTYAQNSEVYHRIIQETNLLPINLSPLGSVGGYLAFPVSQGSLSANEKSLTFRICTNRGKVIQKTFVLHEDTQCP